MLSKLVISQTVSDGVPPKLAARKPAAQKPAAQDLAAKGWRTKPTWVFVSAAAAGVGLVSFLATELLRYLLVPDIGRVRERVLAEAITAIIVSGLTAKLLMINRERHRLIMARMQVIAEMNHHIRNALSPITLSLDATEDQQLKAMISDSVERIDWALREILPRDVPLEKDERHRLGYFQRDKRAAG